MPGHCLQCKKSTSNPKFCSRSCSASYVNKEKPKRKRIARIVCLNCGKGEGWHVSAKFCSSACSTSYRLRQSEERLLEQMKNGEVSSIGNASIIKRLLCKAYGRRCGSCGNDSWCGKPIPLELDHLDGNSGNNTWENLRLICPNCHALTPTYKGKNRGQGRAIRRQRYAEGKSF